jgi:hypothetical protein
MVLSIGMVQGLSAQSFVNGDFEGGSSGWSGCIVEIGTAVTYGGVGTNMVAEVDGNFDPGPSDDRVLCQTISGFIVGGAYRLEFQASRRGNDLPPDPISVILSMDNDALQYVVTRSGGFNMVTEWVEFIATATTHEFRADPDFEGSYGMLFDNLSLTHLYTLPVELLFFTGDASNTGVHLNWATASERDNSHFTVQRSQDGLEFHDVAVVDGVGNSQELTEYSAMDPAPINGPAYYRLKQTDLEGDETIFTAVPVHFEASSGQGLTVYPNPSSGGQLWFTVNSLREAANVPVTIKDLQGRMMRSELIAMVPGVAVDLARKRPLKPGAYLVTVNVGGIVEGVRVVVE